MIQLPKWFYDIQYIQSMIDLERDWNEEDRGLKGRGRGTSYAPHTHIYSVLGKNSNLD